MFKLCIILRKVQCLFALPQIGDTSILQILVPISDTWRWTILLRTGPLCMGWTLILERNFFVRPTSTRTARPKPKCDQKSGILCSGKIPVASFGLLDWVEVGRTKQILSWIKVHPMGTTSGENESILPAQVWELIFWKSPFHSIKWPLGLKFLLLVYHSFKQSFASTMKNSVSISRDNAQSSQVH